MRNLDPIFRHLDRGKAEYFAAAQSVPEERWRDSPGAGSWSAGEVTAHLVMAEETIIDGMKQMLEKPPFPTPFLKRFHVPLWLSTWRVKKVKSPIPLDSNLVFEKPVAMEKFSVTRAATVKFIESTQGGDLNAYRYPHPFLGSLNAYHWFRMIGYHEMRHAKQVREIVEFFRV
jgi:hypothetical protein